MTKPGQEAGQLGIALQQLPGHRAVKGDGGFLNGVTGNLAEEQGEQPLQRCIRLTGHVILLVKALDKGRIEQELLIGFPRKRGV